ncbi:DUF599 domain-containing protein [Flexibacterium corallicola]|uniref:DUF599 domain-containing protein n=1 Tax=Flexibacterium corallicola TaxID=3037259 RepID=UPI00286F99D1|nr:DUF599 family protein [Pseudovibrio sp. M1P-2-3]
MTLISLADLAALIFFIVCWLFYGWIMYHSPWKTMSLSYLMDEHRYSWMQAMVSRTVRIADTNIAAGLQQGTAFFASSCMLAIGGAFAILNSTERVVDVVSDFPLQTNMDPLYWELKALGLIVILAYAFFKFSWAYRLFNYTTIVIGSIREDCYEDDGQALSASKRAARLATLAGRHFSKGQQGLFFAMGYLGWYAGPWIMMASTLCVLGVLLRRQFASRARKAVLDPGLEQKPF